jgi:hypothetical protein
MNNENIKNNINNRLMEIQGYLSIIYFETY